jgi:hypothetical protein
MRPHLDRTEFGWIEIDGPGPPGKSVEVSTCRPDRADGK